MKNKILLTKGFEALIDAEDFARISEHKWFAIHQVLPSGKHYVRAARWISKGKLMYMQYAVLKIKSVQGKEIDHIDGDPLNNTKSNLRLISKIANMRHRVGYTWNTRSR